jgi:hypothetical protein
MIFFVIKPKPHINGISKAGFSDEVWLKNPKLMDFMRTNNTSHYSEYAQRLIPPFSFELNCLEIEDKAKLTDFISGAPNNSYFISEKAKKIIEEYVLPEHKFYKVTFSKYDKKNKTTAIVENYWWFYFRLEIGENVNFEETILNYQLHAYDARLDIPISNINSFEEYKNAVLKTKKGIRAKKIVMNKNFNTEIDVWATQYLMFETFFSERIIERFKREKLTGYDILGTVNIFT